MDYGCGTGRSGLGLKKYGFKVTHGVDGSEGMMSKIPDGLYQSKLKHLVGINTLPSEYLDKFDLVICSGCMGPSHFPDTSLDEAHTVLKKGGFFGFDIRASFYDESYAGCEPYRKKTEALVKEGKYKVVREQEVEKGFSKGTELNDRLVP